MSTSTQASVSVAIATGQGWPHIRECVQSLEVAAAAVHGEVVVADNSGQPPPPDGTLAASTRWLSFPRGSVYSVRSPLLEACSGDVICLTKDHCLVEPDWALTLRDLHARFPEALRDRLAGALPYMLLLLFCQVSGQVTGILFGAGNSPLFVEG